LQASRTSIKCGVCAIHSMQKTRQWFIETATSGRSLVLIFFGGCRTLVDNSVFFTARALFIFWTGPLRVYVNFSVRLIAAGVESCWGNLFMRILSVFALYLATTVVLPATGQSTQSVPPAPGKNASTQNASAQPSAQKGATANTSAQSGSQQDSTSRNSQADTSEAQRNLWLALGQTAAAPKTGAKRSLPQMSFDRGIYAGRNIMTGSRDCLAIQSYNFSEAAPGKTPKLESITTCTSVTQPLLRNARKPGNQNRPDQESQRAVPQPGVNQPDQNKDQR